MIFFIAQQAGWKITEEAARWLYIGILGYTGRFKFGNTTANTYFAVSELTKLNFSTADIIKELETTTESELRVKGYVLSNFKTTENVAYCYVSKQTQDDLKTTSQQTSNAVNVLESLGGIESWFLAVDNGDGSARIRLRSKNTQSTLSLICTAEEVMQMLLASQLTQTT